MSCSDISALAPLYLAGDLDPVRATGFVAHLRACPACALEMRQQAASDDMLRKSLRSEDVDTSAVDTRVRAAIHRDRATVRRWFIAAAAAVLFAAALGYRMFSRHISPVYAAAARDHRIEIVERQHRKWLTDRIAIESLAVRQGFPDSVVAALAPAGYRVAQGKLCLLNGRIFLHLVYVNDSLNFSVFLGRPGDPTISSPIETDTLATQHIAGFAHGQLNGLIVTEQAGDTASRLATFAASVL